MFRLPLFRIRAFTAGNLASLLSSLGRGGLMFVLIIWLQGICLPRHGYSFSQTPLWAGIFMLPLTVGFLVAGPVSGRLSDRFGARPFATGGMVVAAASFLLLELLPVNFTYLQFALILLLIGLGMGVFASPEPGRHHEQPAAGQPRGGRGHERHIPELGHGAVHRHLLHPDHPGPGLLAAGRLYRGLVAQGVPRADAARVADLPPVSVLFAAFLGYNPIQTLLGPALAKLPASHAAYLTGRSFFPALISPPFSNGLSIAFDFAIAACLIAAVASLLRGRRYVHEEHAGQQPARGAGSGPPAARSPSGGPVRGPPGTPRP